MNFSIIQEKMSLNLLKREVEKDIEVFDAKKLKLEHSKPKKKSKSKGSKFQFNDKERFLYFA